MRRRLTSLYRPAGAPPADVAPAVSTNPLILSTPTVGSPVASAAATFTGSPMPTILTEWLIGSTVVATGAAFTPTSGQAGGSLRRRDTASNGVGSPAVATSAAATIVSASSAPGFSAAPAITYAREGEPITSTAGTATGTPTPTLATQILLNGAVVSNTANYTVPSGVAGQTIVRRDTATNGISPNAVASSAAYTVLAAASGGSTVIPAMEVEYVDASGARQRMAVVDGVTSISGVAPFLVKFMCVGTRSTQADGDDEEGCFRRIGHRINFGENLGGTWTYPNASDSRDEDVGPPIFYRAFTNVGSNVVRYRARDSAGSEATISLTVNVAAPTSLTTVNIPPSAGAWPTFVSNRYYTLQAGGDYSSFGRAALAGQSNVIFGKIGSGADPIAQIAFEDRFYGANITRSAGIRTHNIDVTMLTLRAPGFDYCGCVGGRVRQITSAPYQYEYDQRVASGNQAQADSVRFPRGFFLWNTGVTNATGDYVLIESIDSFCLYGAIFVNGDTANSQEHNLRGTYRDMAVRYSNLYNTAQQKTIVKFQACEAATSNGPPPAWREDDRVGNYAAGAGVAGRYGYPSYRSFLHRTKFGAAGEVIPETVIAVEPQNNDNDGTKEGIDLCGVEDCVTHANTPESFGVTVNVGGRNIFVRNFKTAAGAQFSTSLHNQNKVPAGWQVGLLNEATNTRPMPSAFS